ncbi:MAG TPA: glycoside hydrolase family 97 N-terminal domain-containing protein [Tepidisphaeraceae bacterium]|jgi:alpha-glucosidase|nr:glycoside hydrolase family 97 N-terminal domain-containing protein [Tepidisphaeraceae bacterium]
MLLLAVSARGADTRIESPDGKVAIEFLLQDKNAGAPAYRIQYNGKPIVEESRLGFEPDFIGGFQITGCVTRTQKGEWENAFGERRKVPDNYMEMIVDLKHTSGKLLQVIFRAYNEGAALRYAFPSQETKEFKFAGEHTEFRFPKGTWGYEEHGTEGDYRRAKIEDIRPWCERPLTVEYASGQFATLMEADNERYPRMLLSPLSDSPGALTSSLGGATSNTTRGGRSDGSIAITAGGVTPWRAFIVGEKPGDLLERNYLLLNLNPPSEIKDTSWIKPGKAMRDAALSTASAKAIVDLAPKLGLDYVGFDWHWYGNDDAGDATQVRKAGLDIKEVAAYAKAHGLKVCVYVDGRQVKQQADVLFPLFKKEWGVDAVKIGFVAVGPQVETSWITDVIDLAAKNQIMLDIHDGYRSTGNNRTYPNLLTVEGIQGNEHHPTPEHNCCLPFTRYVGGSGDYTVCYLDKRDQTTHAHQLAMGVVSFSPLQWLYWYDRPQQYQEVPPEMEMWVHMPTVWDETKVIDGKIGEYASIARRHGDEWFVGTINNTQPRELDLPLGFLSAGQKYLAHVYSDDDTTTSATHVRCEVVPVDSTTKLHATLKAGGGQAVWIQDAK